MKLKPLYTWIMIGCSILIIGGGCTQASTVSTPEEDNMKQIQLTSSAFKEGETIPQKYTCSGENSSPPLEWSGVPNEAQSLALIVDDPDAPGGTWVHWVVYDIAPGLTQLPEGLVKYASEGGIGTEGVNDFRKTGYRGPCPPPGPAHRYFFKLYALDTRLQQKPGASKAEVLKAMQGHILAQGELMGKFGR